MNTNRLQDALLDIKFRNQPGTHINGEPCKPMTGDEVVDFIAKRMRLAPVMLKPLYTIDWDKKILHSTVTGHNYRIDQWSNGAYTIEYFGMWKGPWTSTYEAIDWLAVREREDDYEYAF